MKRKGWRLRDTGPCHPLAKVKCHHGPAFTLYPPGYGPYQRELAAPVSPAGKLVRIGASSTEAENSGQEMAGGVAWWRTVFRAALDAARGVLWSRGSPVDDPRRLRTQKRHIVLTATLLGLTSEIKDDVVQHIADCLGVAYLVLSDLRRDYKASSTHLGRGTTIIKAVELIPVDRTLDKRLMTAGYIAGLWGKPEWWDPG